MIKLYSLLSLLFIGSLAIAQSDTTKIKIGEKEIEFILKDASKLDSLEEEIEQEVEVAMEEMEKELKNLDEDKKKEKKIDYEDFSFLAGIEVYSNLLFNSDMNLDGIEGPITLNADPARSINLGFTVFDKYIPIAKQHVGLVTGLTFRYVSYNFTEDFEFGTAQDGDIGLTAQDNRSYSKNRLRAGFVRVPVLLQFATGQEKKKSFHFAVGAYAGVKMGNGKYKTEYTENNQVYNSASKGQYNLSNFDYGLEARVGHGNISLLASYSSAGLFNTESSFELNGANVGLALTF